MSGVWLKTKEMKWGILKKGIISEMFDEFLGHDFVPLAMNLFMNLLGRSLCVEIAVYLETIAGLLAKAFSWIAK